MKASTKRFASILLSILFLVFSVLIYSKMIVPLYGDINKERSLIAKKEEQYQNFKKLSENYKNLDQKYSNSVQFKDALAEAMPMDQQIPAELNQITTLVNVANTSVPAGLGNLRLNSVTVKEDALLPSKSVSVIKGRGVVNLNMTLAGSYEAFKKYMSLLEQNSRLISVNSLNFRADVQNANNFLIDLSVDTYYQLK